MARRVAFAAGLSLALALVVAYGCSDERIPTTLPPAHPADWQDSASADFHGKVVVQRGAAACQVCHGVDFTGGKVGVSCVECHLQSPGLCLSCHGGKDNTTAAPPLGLRGETDDTTRAVGAHTTHLEGDQISDGVPCASCHLVPIFLFDSLHLDIASGPTPDSIAEIVWGDIASAPGAAWNRGAASCTNTYCHGNFTGGETGNAPVWTGGAGQASCGSCHDVGGNPDKLGWKHEYHVGQGLRCADCHAGVVDTLDHVTDLTRHVNGMVDTLTRDVTVCQTCHGGAPSTCVYCHGGTDNLTGAPPLGLRDEVASSTLAVGAHSAHVENGALADAFDCIECHLKPSDITTPGHYGVDSIAEITWGGIAPAPGINWNRGAATCANTYCHGNFPNGSSGNTPVWTAGAGQAACGSCHDVGNDPKQLSGRHEKHVKDKGYACAACHAGTVNLSLNIVGPDLHVNDNVEIIFGTGQGNWDGTDCTNVGCHGRESWR